jgi:hypothetical protein
MEEGKIEELWHWKWDEVNGWQRLDDMKEDFGDL